MNRMPIFYLCVAEEFRYGRARSRRRSQMLLGMLAGVGSFD
jgi:hypothetical protein